MENKAHALLAGLFTIALLIAAVLIAIWLNRDRVERVPYEIATTLSVPGLNPQAGVRYRGLEVGRVDAVLFNPQKPGQILIRFSVSKDTPITQSTFATLNYQGVTGLAYVQLDDDGSKPILLPSSAGKVARIELRQGFLDSLQVRAVEILKQTEVAMGKINAVLSEENQRDILAAFKDVSNAANKVATIPEHLEPTLKKLPALTLKADNVLTSLNKLSDDATRLTGSLNEFATRVNAPDGPLNGFNGAVNNIGSAASTVEYEVVPLIDETRTTMRALNRTLETVNQQPQSILFGVSPAQPGPGEAGFTAPTSK